MWFSHAGNMHIAPLLIFQYFRLDVLMLNDKKIFGDTN